MTAPAYADLAARVRKAVSRGKHARIELEQAKALMASPAWAILTALESEELLKCPAPARQPEDRGPSLPLDLPEYLPRAASSSAPIGYGIAPIATIGASAGSIAATTPELRAAAERAALQRALAAGAQPHRRSRPSMH